MRRKGTATLGSTVEGTEAMRVQLDLASMPDADIRFVADSCEAEATREGLWILFGNVIRPSRPVPLECLSVRMARLSAEAFLQSFSLSFRKTLTEVAHSGRGIPFDPAGVPNRTIVA